MLWTPLESSQARTFRFSDQTVIRPARDPKHAQLLIGFRVEPGKLRAEIFRQASGAEGANPGKLVQIIQSGQQGLGAAHRQPAIARELRSLETR